MRVERTNEKYQRAQFKEATARELLEEHHMTITMSEEKIKSGTQLLSCELLASLLLKRDPPLILEDIEAAVRKLQAMWQDTEISEEFVKAAMLDEYQNFVRQVELRLRQK
jgi:hypothetical protein